MPDLLFLTQRLPYPPNKGEKIRPLHILKYLAQWYDVHLGCLIDDPADAYIDAVAALCRDVHIAPLGRHFARFWCLRGLLTGEPLSVAFFRNRDLGRWVRDLVTTIRPAVIFINSSNMAPYVLDLPRCGMRVVDLADMDSEKWRAYADVARGPMSIVYRREWRKVAALERRIARECDLLSFVSEAEAALLSHKMPECTSRIRGVSSGVDHCYFDPDLHQAPVYDALHPTYVFTGTMDYPPNVDAVSWFVAEILPAIRHTVRSARFYIVGANPTSEVRCLSLIEGVFVTGRVADVRPYVVHATASVAPMRIARGIQNKVLEAMSLSRPVVLTREALSGIKAVPGQQVILADTAQDFAAACSRLATQGDQAGLVSPRARSYCAITIGQRPCAASTICSIRGPPRP